MLESELFAFLDSTADAAFSITDTGEILSWNAAAEALFGFKASEVLNKHCYEILDARGRLGTSICMRDCAVQRCALHAGPVTLVSVHDGLHGERGHAVVPGETMSAVAGLWGTVQASGWRMGASRDVIKLLGGEVTTGRAASSSHCAEAHELLPRIATSPDHFECQRCPWARRCWSLQP